MPENRLLNTDEAAKYLSVSKSFLNKDRANGKLAKIPYVQLSANAIRYRLSDLDDYVKKLLRR